MLTFRQFFYLGDAFFGGQVRSKEGGRIYANCHHFCNHELVFTSSCHMWTIKLKLPWNIPATFSRSIGIQSSCKIVSVWLVHVRMHGPKTPCMLIIFWYWKPVDGIWEKRKYSIRGKLEFRMWSIWKINQHDYGKLPKHLPPNKVPSDQIIDSFSIAFLCF